MNKVILLGRLVKDPDVRYTQTGKVVTQITLAVNRPFTNQDGQREADFIPVIFWGKQAETIGNSFAKGNRILVEGRLQIRSYDGKDGSKRYVTEVIGETFEFIERKTPAAGDDSGNYGEFGSTIPFNEEIPCEEIDICPKEGNPYSRPRVEISNTWITNYQEWKKGKITAVEFMRRENLKKTTFYKLVKEYEQGGCPV